MCWSWFPYFVFVCFFLSNIIIIMMKEEEEKTKKIRWKESCLVLMSNVNRNDKLNQFTNPIPTNFLSENHTHFAAVVGLGVHAIFKNTAIKSTKMPSIMMLFRKEFTFQTGFDLPSDVEKPLELSTFKSHQCIYLDQSKSYTPHELHQHIFQVLAAFNYSLEQIHKGFASR